ncbi:PREDICTED: PHD finger protein 7-like, partial [Merops nubicus]|uniref:PHD finger protein 7-like n=1 Tax=Merops nubicus TaxID=57421 RepID=UPI0004F090E1
LCVLCRRAEADPGLCGRNFSRGGLGVHEFCLIFATQLSRLPAEDPQLFRYRCRDILQAVERAAQKTCCVCKKTGPTITCGETGCERSFHLPCATEGGCVTQYFSPYRCFCAERRPEQALGLEPEKNTRCLICLERLEEPKPYLIPVCPVCKHACFHRGCIQGLALQDGITQLQCPLCRDKDGFGSEMLRIGVRVPFQLPSWDAEAHAELSARHGRCDASECLCPAGREWAEQEGHEPVCFPTRPWGLVLCSSGAAGGTHRGCSRLGNSTQGWECPG